MQEEDEVIVISDSEAEAPAPKRQRGAEADDVAIVAPPAPVLAAAGAESDDEVVLLGVTGEDALKDFPHARHTCRNFKFDATAPQLHKLYCPKCHCFVCDVEASECEQWGDGSSSADHCHAHAADAQWQRARSARQQQQAAQSGGAPPQAPPAAAAANLNNPYAAAAANPLWPYPPPAAPAAPPAPVPLAPGHVRKPPANPEPLPDPATLPGLRLLVSGLRLAVEAEEGSTVEALAARLPPFGMLATEEWHSGRASKGGKEPLPLPSLFRAYGAGGMYGLTAPGEKPPPSLLSLLPLPPTEAAAGAAVAATAQHPARLVLMHADGTEPIEFVVHLSPEVTGAELLAQAASLASLDGAEEQLVIFSADTYVPRPGSKELATCRLRTWVAGAQSEHNSLRYGRQICGHSEESLGQKLRPGTRLANTFSTFYATRLPRGRWVAVFLRKLGVRTITHKRARDVRAFGPSSELVTKSPFGCICILPAPEAMGGMKAEKELQASLRAFLAPFLAPEAEYEPPDLFHVADATGMWEEALAHWHVAGNSNAEVSYRTARPELPAHMRDSLSFVGADWDEATLAQFDVSAMVSPKILDASSVADRASELDTLQREWEEKRSKERAGQVLNELATAGRVSWQQHLGAYDYSSRTRAEGSWSRRTPLVRLRMALEAEAPGSRRGHLTFDVWVSAQALDNNWTGVVSAPVAQHCTPLFSSDGMSGNAPAQLQHTLTTLLEASGDGFKAHARSLRELLYRNSKDPRVTTIPGLLAAIESQERAEAPQPAGLNCALRNYQKQALGFCLEAERRTTGPFWFCAPLPPSPAAPGAAAAPATEMFFCPLLQRLSIEAPPMPRGGFLCEEMGLGKTVISLGLILAAPQSAAEKAEKAAKHAAAIAAAGSNAAARARVLIPTGATLVVCMVSIVGQWIEEARSKLAADSELKIHMYHNTNREKDPAKLAKFDLVVTTYQTLGTDFGKRNAAGLFPPLGSIDWHRIILDESHSIKSAKVQQSIACSSLHASRRWCVSGTPMATEVADLFGQVVFLKLSPLDQNAVFEAHVKRAYQTSGNHYGGEAATLLYALTQTMVRHTKSQTLGGAAVLSLPPKSEVEIAVHFTPAERAAYDKTYKAARAQFDGIKAQGQVVVSRSLLAIMSLLVPLRRIASGGALTDKELEVTDLAAAAAARSAAASARALQHAQQIAAAMGIPYPGLGGAGAGTGMAGVKSEGKMGGGAAAAAPAASAGGSAEGKEDEDAAIDAALAADAKPVLTMPNEAEELCGLCSEVPEQPVRTGCMHWFCRECLLAALPERISATKCPTCNRFMNAGPLRAAEADGEEEDDDSPVAPAAAAAKAAKAPSAAKAPKPKPAAKSKPAAKANGRRRADSDEEEDFATDMEADTSDGEFIAAPVARSERPRRAVRGAAGAAAAPSASAPASDADKEAAEKELASDGEDEAPPAAKPKAPKPAAKPAKVKVPAAAAALQSESKMKALLDELTKMRDEDESSKALIFSQFNSTLLWLQKCLLENGFQYRSISGSMPLKQRAKAIEAFQRDPPTTVFLLSMRSGAVGVNLTAANRVFLMEPVMTPALEAQAIGRSHRMGQQRAVTVTKFFIKDSVEERILALNAQRAAGQVAGSAAMDELVASKGKGKGKKLLQSEIAGAIRDDKQVLRLNELDLLFS